MKLMIAFIIYWHLCEFSEIRGKFKINGSVAIWNYWQQCKFYEFREILKYVATSQSNIIGNGTNFLNLWENLK